MSVSPVNKWSLAAWLSSEAEVWEETTYIEIFKIEMSEIEFECFHKLVYTTNIQKFD